MLDLDRRVSLAEEAKGQRVVSLLDAAAGKSIDYGPSNPKRVVNIFTDIDCGYCRKLHNEIGQLTAAGVQVRYFAFPRAGLNSPSYAKYTSVWCADDRNAAMDAAKAGMQPPAKSCENPGGYKPANVLIQELGL